MTVDAKPPVYRAVLDALVEVCREGQGQIGARRARAGIWNANGRPDFIPDQHAFNDVLSRMSSADRQVLAAMLEGQVVLGVFETLKVLEEFRVSPFEDGYEGSPQEDFAGRMADWPWPES